MTRLKPKLESAGTGVPFILIDWELVESITIDVTVHRWNRSGRDRVVVFNDQGITNHYLEKAKMNRSQIFRILISVIAVSGGMASVVYAQLPSPTSPPIAIGNEVVGRPGDEGAVGAGGGSMADFGSLMNLIQQTIEPDNWEALGGVSTMAPYPAGVMVDPDGLLRAVDSDSNSSQSGANGKENRHAAAISQMLHIAGQESGADDNGGVEPENWKSPAKMRCVSVRRMMQAYAAIEIVNPAGEVDVDSNPDADRPIIRDDALVHMAGLSRVRYMIVTPDDVVLVGTVGGILEENGWMIDAETRMPMMNLVSLAVGLIASRSATPFGCTIDPSPEGLRSAAELGQRIVGGKIPMVTAADQLATALGQQSITVFGTSANHEVAYLMIEADRHMKRLALGKEPMPERIGNYLQAIARTGDGTPPTDLLLRLWFTAQPLHVRTTGSGSNRIFEIAGTPIQLSGQNELSLPTGERGHVVVDPATITFVDHFNQNWNSIRSTYPVYGGLESIYACTAIAELWTRNATTGDHRFLQRALLYFAAEHALRLPPPAKVDSIAVYHRYQRGRKRHQVLLASGGVKIAPQDLISESIPNYPAIQTADRIADRIIDHRPTDRWWWNEK